MAETIMNPDMLQSGVLGINHEITLDANTQSAVFSIPARLSALTWQATIDGVGGYEVLATVNKLETIRSGTPDWYTLGGARTASAQVTIPARVTAVKFVRTSGTIRVAFYAA